MAVRQLAELSGLVVLAGDRRIDRTEGIDGEAGIQIRSGAEAWRRSVRAWWMFSLASTRAVHAR